jgi:dihydropyrimidinase
LQVVATDHCAFSDDQKKMGINDFTKIPNGTGGLEDRMRVLWTMGVGSGRLTPEEFVAATSTNIARILNVFPTKGAIMPGADADIVIWDPRATSQIRAKEQISRAQYNVFEGFECIGGPKMTLSRGTIAWTNGDFRAEPGAGKYVPRPAFPAIAVADAAWRKKNAPRAVRRLEVVP